MVRTSSQYDKSENAEPTGIPKGELVRTARHLVQKGKGILAIDETSETLAKRLKEFKIAANEKNRLNYRKLLCTTGKLEQYISGVILVDETFRQAIADRTSFPSYLKSKGIFTGIKVDTRAWPLAGRPSEVVTEGLDGLRDRLEEYRTFGAWFCKWRAVIKIGDGIPSNPCITANTHALARYAALCQENGLVPIVEPEVLMDGDHDIRRCEDVTTVVLENLFSDLLCFGVKLGAVVLKANMVISGEKGPEVGADEVAEATLRCLHRCVPHEVPGIVFLSGGQTPQRACENLNAINKISAQPWKLSFSFGRALQNEAMETWSGENGKIVKAQRVFRQRAKSCSDASLGRYTGTSSPTD